MSYVVVASWIENTEVYLQKFSNLYLLGGFLLTIQSDYLPTFHITINISFAGIHFSSECFYLFSTAKSSHFIVNNQTKKQCGLKQ